MRQIINELKAWLSTVPHVACVFSDGRKEIEILAHRVSMPKRLYEFLTAPHAPVRLCFGAAGACGYGVLDVQEDNGNVILNVVPCGCHAITCYSIYLSLRSDLDI